MTLASSKPCTLEALMTVLGADSERCIFFYNDFDARDDVRLDMQRAFEQKCKLLLRLDGNALEEVGVLAGFSLG